MKVLFVVNPIAGKGTASKCIPDIRTAMDQFKDIEYSIINTERAGHAIEIARRGAADGTDIIFAVGGDGTTNEVANGLVYTKCALAIIPAGSGNDFVRSINLSGSTHEIIERTLKGKRKYIDVGCINNRYFINISSIGFDAQVVINTQKVKRIFLSGSAAYLVALIITIFTWKSVKVKIEMNGMVIEEKMLLSAIANGKYYGGGMKAAPEAVLDDGMFDVCLIKTLPKIKMLILFPQFMKGKHGKFHEVSFHRTEKIVIKSDKPLPINVDGEVYTDDCVSFEIIKNAIMIALPE